MRHPICFALAGLLLCSSFAVRGAFTIADGATILFLGDSNTFAEHQVAYFEAYLFTRFPSDSFRVVNRGMPSETASGTSEPSHIPPRPNVHDRLASVLANVHPSVVIASYGMNDGIYVSPNPEIFAKYQAGIRKLVERIGHDTSARVVLVTPPPFDATPYSGRKPSGDYRGPAQDYDNALKQFSDWLQTLRGDVDRVIDIHTPIASVLASRRASDSGFKFADDGVHIDKTGHMIWALELLKGLGAPAEIGAWEVDPKTRDHRKSFPLPMPHDPQWDTECLRLAGFDEALNRLQLKFSQPPDKPMSAALTASGTSLRATLEISAGARQVDLYPAYLRLVSNRAQEVLGLVQQRRQAMLELWVRNDPHPRLAGMHRDSTATQEQIDTLEQKIRSLCRPVELALRLTPL